MRFTLLAAACAGIFANAPTLAQSTTLSAATSGITYQLVDLDLTDSITPAITFMPRNGSGTLTLSAYAEGKQTFGSLSGFGSKELTHALGSTGGTVSATGSLVYANLLASARPITSFWTQSLFTLNFRLTPSTGLLVSSVFDLDVTKSGNHAAPTTWAALQGYTRDPLSPEGQFESGLNEYRETKNGAFHETVHGYLFSGKNPVYGYVGTTAVATVGAISPVPEPSTWMLLLAGFALLGHRMRKAAA